MNGVHDMGGMHGFGPIEIEAYEPVFHDEWEGRVYGMVTSIREEYDVYGPYGSHSCYGGHISSQAVVYTPNLI